MRSIFPLSVRGNSSSSIKADGNIVWGTGELDNIVWGTIFNSNGDNIVWGTHGSGDNIVISGGDVALTLGRHHPDRVSALIVTS